ncbi:MAG: hypothetical protein R3E60_04200 [Alphaproteobacteria bacterium]
MTDQNKVTKPSGGNFLFGPVQSFESAQKQARIGAYAAYAYAGVIVLIAVTSLLSPSFNQGVMGPTSTSQLIGATIGMLIEALIYGGLGYAISRGSRVAAVVSLVAFVLEKIVFLPPKISLIGVVFSIAMLVLFTIGIRGTVAWHRLNVSPQSN